MKKLTTSLIGLAIILSLIIGCAAEKLAENGDKVKVHYTGTLEDGTVFDSSEGREPIEFTIAAGMMIPGFDNGVRGMQIGEKRSITISPADAYGLPRDDMIIVVPKSQFPPEMEYTVGQELTLQTADGRPIRFTVLEIREDSVQVDMNHPLAGETLIFNVEMVEIIKPEN